MPKKSKTVLWQRFLFICYLVLLVWIILFKLQLSFQDIDHIRTINLLPFHYNDGNNARLHLKEVAYNIAVFVPFGIYLCMLAEKQKTIYNFLIILASAVGFEMMQYLLAIGSSDVTDILTNASGGLIGIGLYSVLIKITNSREKVNRVITIFATALTILVIGGLSLLIFQN